MQLAKQPDINQQLTWLEGPKWEIRSFFQILIFCATIILFITPVLLYVLLYLVYQAFILYILIFVKTDFCFFHFSFFLCLSWNINKCTNELLLGITLNIPESIHISFVILSTCQMCRDGPIWLLLLIKTIIWNCMDKHTQFPEGNHLNWCLTSSTSITWCICW